MVIDLIGEAGVSGFVGPDHGFELDAVAIWHDQPIPDDLCPFPAQIQRRRCSGLKPECPEGSGDDCR